MPLRAVLFDLGGTLVYQTNSTKVFKRLLQDQGIKRSLAEVDRAFNAVQKRLPPRRFEHMPLRKYFQSLNLLTLKELGVTKDQSRLARLIDRKWFERAKIRTFPETKRVLGELRRLGIKVGLVTNLYDLDVRRILHEFNLARKFDVVVTAEEVGRVKPHSSLFRLALRKLRVRPSQTIFVGDNLEMDCMGAAKVGITPVLIDREGRGARDIRSIRSLEEVLLLIE